MSLRKAEKSALQSGCKDFEKEFLLKHFYYDNGVLYWRTTGARAGYCRDKRGYWVISKGKKRMLRHRAVWIMHNGPIPEGKIVNHINGTPGDDRIENLEVVPQKENVSIKRVNKNINNVSGITGVSYRSERDKWYANIMVDHRTISLGNYEDFFEACCARKSAENKRRLGAIITPIRLERTSKYRVNGIEYQKAGQRYLAYYYNECGKKVRLGSSKNFFDAVCLRKSWEASL
jgi:hypothetical protein